MNNLLKETQESYYNYIRSVGDGALFISKIIRTGNISEAYNFIVNLSEGLEWLLKVEGSMKQYNYTILSATEKATGYLNDINEGMKKEDYIFVADLFEYEISPIFREAESWKFEKQ